MSDDSRGGNDILIAAVDGNPDSTSIVLVGDASNMSGNAHGGDDILLGSSRDDLLYGDAQTYASVHSRLDHGRQRHAEWRSRK